MAVLFSEYLIEQKQVTDEQVLTALIEQLRSTPSLAEISYEKSFLPTSDLLKILFHCQHHSLDFRSSAEQLGLCSGEVWEKIYSQLQTLQKPLGEILVEKGFVSVDTLSSLLVSYVENTNKPQSDNASRLDPILLKEYIAAFSRAFSNIGAEISSLESCKEQGAESKSILKNIHSEFITIAAAASFLGAKQSEKIAQFTLKFLEVFISIEMPIEIKYLTNTLTSVSQILNSICQYLHEFKQESQEKTV
ncbi:MAG: hypothetical protein V4591_01680 [Bdellovibrionota bacterium]